MVRIMACRGKLHCILIVVPRHGHVTQLSMLQHITVTSSIMRIHHAVVPPRRAGLTSHHCRLHITASRDVVSHSVSPGHTVLSYHKSLYTMRQFMYQPSLTRIWCPSGHPFHSLQSVLFAVEHGGTPAFPSPPSQVMRLEAGLAIPPSWPNNTRFPTHLRPPRSRGSLQGAPGPDRAQ